MLIDEYLHYLERVRRASANTLRLRETYMRQLAADLDPAEATDAQLRAWIAARPDWSRETVNAVTSTFRSFYRWAFEVGRIATDPAARLPRLRVPQRVPRIATEEQIAAGLASADRRTRVATRLGAECGLRVHEMAKLATTDRRGEWLVIVGKGGYTRTVYVSPELADELDALEAEHGPGYYFPSPRGGHLTAEAIRQRIRRVLGTNPHSLRHRAGTTVYRGTGNDLRLAQVFLGHRNPQTTAVYVHVQRADLMAAGAAARIAA